MSFKPFAFAFAFAFALALVACNPLAENPAATAACGDAGPGWGATDIPCTNCCKANGGIGRHSDKTRCICIGK